jgi:hypothetical protein
MVYDKRTAYLEDLPHLKDASHAHLDVIVDHKLKLHFDTHDAVEVAAGDLDRCDFYFKRSFSPDFVERFSQQQKRKILPLGLNYQVLLSAIDLASLHRNLALNMGVGNKLRGVKHVLDFWNCLGFQPRLKDLESAPDLAADPKVLFLASTHRPGPENSAEKAEERRTINDYRAECIRVLRKGLGDRFLGGFNRSAFSLQHYADVVIPDQAITTQSAYLRTMKRYPICIATTGLHGSTGWKLAEYVACSRAILSERLRYAVPGDFSHGNNYLEFSSPKECLEKAKELIESKELRTKLMQNNATYYRLNLRPDALVRNALTAAAELKGA